MSKLQFRLYSIVVVSVCFVSFCYGVVAGAKDYEAKIQMQTEALEKINTVLKTGKR